MIPPISKELGDKTNSDSHHTTAAAKGNSKFHFDLISLNTVLFDFNVEPN